MAEKVEEITAEDVLAAHECWHSSALDAAHPGEDGRRRTHPSAVGRMLGVGADAMAVLTTHAAVLADEGDEQAFLSGTYYGFCLGLLAGQRKH